MTETLTLSLRELRLILERLVQAAGTPPGLLPSVRDCTLYSALLPGPGLAGIARQIERLHPQAAPLVLVAEQPLLVDCAGQHAWLVAETLLDLAVEAFRRTGEGRVVARAVAEPQELRVVAGLAERFGLQASVTPTNDGMRLDISYRPVALPILLDTIRISGWQVPAELWWPLYEASHAALAEDSFASRRHAGTIRVEEDGRIVGRNDEDETDLAMLAPDPSRLRPASVSGK